MAAEVAHQILARVIGDYTLVADRAHEANVIEDVLKRVVRLAQGAESFIEHIAERFGRIVQPRLQIRPAGSFRNEEPVVEIRILAVLRLHDFPHHSPLDSRPNDFLPLGVEHVRAALQKQHPEDEIFIGRRIQTFLAESIRSGIEVAFELGERKFRHA